jgi:hypothetical protein
MGHTYSNFWDLVTFKRKCSMSFWTHISLAGSKSGNNCLNFIEELWSKAMQRPWNSAKAIEEAFRLSAFINMEMELTVS